MRTIAAAENIVNKFPVTKFLKSKKIDHLPAPMVHGMHKKIIKTGIWINIFLCSLFIIKSPLKVFKAMKKLKDLRDNSRESHTILKYAKVGSTYYYSLNSAGLSFKGVFKIHIQ